LSSSFFSPDKERNKGWVFFILMAVIFLSLGIFIAANFDLTGISTAQTSTNISETGTYPVVESNNELESPFVKIVEKVKNAVVNISARSAKENTLPW